MWSLTDFHHRRVLTSMDVKHKSRVQRRKKGAVTETSQIGEVSAGVREVSLK